MLLVFSIDIFAFISLQTVNLHIPRDPKHGLINNQVCDWSFKVDGVLHGASQDAVFTNTSLPLVNDALDGFVY